MRITVKKQPEPRSPLWWVAGAAVALVVVWGAMSMFQHPARRAPRATASPTQPADAAQPQAQEQPSVPSLPPRGGVSDM